MTEFIYLYQALKSLQQLPPKLGLVPQCDLKHCLTNSKHQHILWPLKYAKMRFRLGARTPLGSS